MTAEPCTTWSQRKRHYSANLTIATYGPGRTGVTLCHEDADDEEHANHRNAEYGQKPVVLADLPECKRCARTLAKEEA